MAKWPYGTRRWRMLRAMKLATNPLCEMCLKRGRVVPATAVDHNQAIAAGGDPFPPLEELTSCCTPCHNFKTNVVDHPNAERSNKLPLRGCDLDGRPLDPDHPWNKEQP